MSGLLQSAPRSIKKMMLGLACASALSVSPAFAKDKDVEQTNDPLESVNRAVFEFNMTLDKYALAPVARGYRDVMPTPARIGIRNVLVNILAPIDLLNNLLQGDLEGSGVTLKRFIVNSTAGIGGLMDVAAETGDVRQQEDFGQTLAVWGFEPGPYLMLPLLGPSNPRDATGMAVDVISDPFFWLALGSEWHLAETASWTVVGLGVLEKRVPLLDPLEELERTSVDYYVAVRDYSRQQRMLKIMNRSTQERPEQGEGYRFDFPADF